MKGSSGIWPALTLAGVFVAGAGAQGQTVTVEDAVRAALSTNPTLEVRSHNRRAVDEELRQARGLFLPQLDIAAGYGPEYASNITTRQVTNQDPRWLDRQELSATLSQRLFDGFDAASRTEREKARVRSAARRVYESAEFLALDATGAFLEVRRQRELLELAETNVKVHRDMVGDLQRQLERGAGSRANVSQAESRLAQARATRTEVVNGLRDAEALYRRVVGVAPETLAEPSLPAAELPTDRAEAEKLILQQNPTVRIAEADIEAAESEVGISEATFWPRVNLEASSSYFDGRDGVDTYEHSSAIMLRARWNLYRGGIDVAQRRESLMRVAEAKSRRYSAAVDAREELARSLNALEAAERRVSEYGEAVRFATDTRGSYREQFTVGQRTLLDVLDSENELFLSTGRLVTAQSNLQRARYRVLAVLGRLLKTLDVQAPEAADESVPSFWKDVSR